MTGIVIPPAPPAALLDAAFAAFQGGDAPRAEALCDAVLRQLPKQPDALLLRGILLHQAGKRQRAAQMVEKALAERPRFPQAFYSQGLMRQEAGNLTGAVAAYRRAVELQPDFLSAWINLGVALRGAKRPAEALAAWDRAAALQPDDPNILLNRGHALEDLGDAGAAIDAFRGALARAPDHAGGWRALADLLERQGDRDGALGAWGHAAALEPHAPEPLVRQAQVMIAQERFEPARERLDAALRLAPDDAEAAGALAHVLAYGFGDAAGARPHAERAAAREPTAVRSSALLQILQYDSSLTGEALWARHRDWQARFEAPVTPLRAAARDRDPARRLRVGFVSADLVAHPVAFFLLPLLGALDRAGFELVCYDAARREDPVTARLRALADGWHVINACTAAEAAALIRDHDVDLLVDLAGHTRGDLLEIFARKPAPVQLTWLGYPGSTGLTRIDHRITDAIADPPGLAEAQSSERPLRLPDGFLCYAPRDATPEPGPLPVEQSGSITFGSLNSLAKLSDATVAAWSAVLDAVPGSRLLVRRAALAEAAPRAALAARFAARGIGADRLRLEAGGWHGPFAVYQSIDIALDSLPYHGTTTTCEALWMGVPVVTLMGDRHAARVGGSLLARVGLSDLAAASPAAFVATAAGLAADRDRLAGLRAGLRARMAASPLCDAPGFARAFGAALRGAWQAHLDGTGIVKDFA